MEDCWRAAGQDEKGRRQWIQQRRRDVALAVAAKRNMEVSCDAVAAVVAVEAMGLLLSPAPNKGEIVGRKMM